MIYKEKKDHNNLNVVCSTSIIGDMVKQISGDNVTIHTLMGPGVDPHLYKPLENDIMSIAQADIIFYNGLHLEAQMEHIFQHLQKYKATVPITKNIPQEKLIASFEYDNHYDPHIWFHLPLWMNTITTITETLSNEDPDHIEEYKENAAKYLKKCKNLFHKTSKLLGEIPKEKRILITGHDAFQYFAQAYDFEVVGLQGISTESQVGSQDIQQLIDFIVTRRIPALFIETSTPIRNIKTIQEGVAQKDFSVEIGGELYSDALGSEGTPENNYLGMIESNINTIYNALMK